MKITLSRTAHAPSTTNKCVALTISRITGACIEMAGHFAVVFDPNNISEIRTSKTEGGGVEEISGDPASGRAKSLGISPGGGGGEIPATPGYFLSGLFRTLKLRNAQK